MAIRVEAVSVEWIEQVIRTTGLLSEMSFESSADGSVGWATERWSFL